MLLQPLRRRSYLHAAILTVSCWSLALAADPVSIGSNRELFVDDYLVESLKGATLELQQPREREVVIEHDEPWEGCASTYHTIFKDGDVYRLYYRGAQHDEETRKPTHKEVFCYAESKDGIHWTKPALGLVEFNGSKANNIILTGSASHNLAPFRDENPAATADEKYKAVGGVKGGLVTFKSPDAIHWNRISEKPVITKGYFDSLNTAFWDTTRGEYLEFHREYRDGIRDIMTCTSPDFAQWSDPKWVEYTGAPPQHLYTNAIVAYDRAPQILVGLPMRYVPGRNPEKHSEDGVSDVVFMTSRDAKTFHRWNEAFIRPGMQSDRWVNRNNLPARGIVVTEPDVPGGPQELSIYATEGYYRGPATRLRRYTLRLDGFVSVSGPAEGGELVTKPVIFATQDGDTAGDVKLRINFATSAVGSLKCELQDEAGKPIPGFTLDECDEAYGDDVDRAVTWKGNGNLAALAGKPVRLRFVLRDADLFAIQFRPSESNVQTASN
jgi:hypothetical protein